MAQSNFFEGAIMDHRQEVKSLKKALRALVILNQRGEATVTDVAQAVGVPRPTGCLRRLLLRVTSRSRIIARSTA